MFHKFYVRIEEIHRLDSKYINDIDSNDYDINIDFTKNDPNEAIKNDLCNVISFTCSPYDDLDDRDTTVNDYLLGEDDNQDSN